MENEIQTNKIFPFIKTLVIIVLHVAAKLFIGIIKIAFIAFANSKEEEKSTVPTRKEIWCGEKLPFSGKYRIK
jgi:hypothetical protein